MIKFLKFLIFIIILGLLLIFSGFIYLKIYETQESSLSSSKIVFIKKGSGFSTITKHLQKENVIDNIYAFKALTLLKNKQGSFRAGEYEFTAGVTADEVILILSEGKVISHSVTLPEGWMTKDILERIDNINILKGTVPQIYEEGTLLPETYFYLRGESKNEVIARMQKSMKKTVNELWKNRQRGLPLKNKKEAIILASIVEKETGVKAERKRVAGVFINRLRKGMKLQSDPTTIYGTYKKTGIYDNVITRSELNDNNPYNTYHIYGLPPEPIANPGKASIEAVLNPIETDELYFVAKGDGGHRFAKTLKEHDANVRLYRQWLKRQR